VELRSMVLALVLSLIVLPSTSMGEKQSITPVEDPSNWPPSCMIPYGYTAACGYYASTANGECYCREGDTETTLCMKANAGAGCGIHESQNDPCCRAQSGF
jgi:hypothetical protein